MPSVRGGPGWSRATLACDIVSGYGGGRFSGSVSEALGLLFSSCRIGDLRGADVVPAFRGVSGGFGTWELRSGAGSGPLSRWVGRRSWIQSDGEMHARPDAVGLGWVTITWGVLAVWRGGDGWRGGVVGGWEACG